MALAVHDNAGVVAGSGLGALGSGHETRSPESRTEFQDPSPEPRAERQRLRPTLSRSTTCTTPSVERAIDTAFFRAASLGTVPSSSTTPSLLDTSIDPAFT